MTGIRNLAIQWYRKAFGAPAGADIREQGLDTVLDGNSAVALSEAAVASHAVLGGSSPAAEADTVWLRELERGGTNLFGETLSADAADGPRGIIAAATGLALAGRRATAFLSGQDAAAVQDLLLSAAGKHAPLVLHLATRAATTHGTSGGSGHDTLHLCADSGCFVLVAQNVQQVTDFTFIARRVAEEALLPGIVVMDGPETALASQDVRLLSPAQVGGFLGPAREEIAAPTPAQKLLFGDTRRRLPAWHSLDRPLLTGAVFNEQSFALGASADRVFFDDFVGAALRRACADFAARTGREYGAISRYRMDKAKTILLAQGAGVETACVAAAALRERHKLRVGVVGVQALRPFPGEHVAEALTGAERVLVLERGDASLAGEPPLTREVRACLSRLDKAPSCHAVVYGIGGAALKLQDIASACLADSDAAQDPIYLGVAFDDRTAAQPKREVMLDALRRAYPQAASRGIRESEALLPTVGGKLITIAIRHRGADARLAGTAGALLHRLQGGRVRTRPAVAWPGLSETRTDFLISGDATLLDPGDGLSPDFTLDCVQRSVVMHGDDTRLSIAGEDAEEPGEALLGGLFGALASAGVLEASARRISAARRDMLDLSDDDERDRLVADFESGFSGLTEAAAVETRANGRREATPVAVRELGHADDHVASLPRFWDQAGVLYRDGIADRLTADPYLATGTMPPLSSTFADQSPARVSMPAFDPTLCTGCGDCWTRCPDIAIGVTAASPAALIDEGIRKTGAEPVRQVASKLAARIIAANKKRDDCPATFGEMLNEAFAWLMEKAPLPDERKQAIEEGIGRIVAEFGALPVAVTKSFFSDAEAQQKDSAELVTIAINPNACKACGICVASCEPGALVSRPQDADTLDVAHGLWETWSTTPDTPGTSVEKAAEYADVGLLPALLLSRYCQFALAGGDNAEAGSGEKVATRQLLAAAEYHGQPIVQRFVKTLAETGDQIRALIHDTLSGALPKTDLDAIAEQLEATTSPRIDLKTLSEGVTGGADDHSIDTRYLRRLIDLSGRLNAAQQQLVEGATGLGRARYGIAVAGGRTAAWAASFPRNPFQAPVVVDMSGDATQLSAGLIEGHLDETTELVRLLRLARLEIDRPDGLEWQRDALKGLRWQDLEPEELELCPPLILIGSDEMLAARGLSQLIWLLNSRLPVKVLVLSSLDLGLVDAPVNDPRAGIGMLAVAQRNAWVAQTSIADAGHFADSVLGALAFDGPALVQVYAPSPERDGFASKHTIEQARIAFATRVLPLFRYDPRATGVFGSRISLAGNPAQDALLGGDDGAGMTPADWALGQQRFASHFEPLPASAPAPIPMDEWLLLDAVGRKAKTPFVTAGDGETQLGLSPALLRVTRECLDRWQTLQELAGVVTPFTEKLEAEIRAEVAAEHAAELDRQKQEAAAELAEIRQQTQNEIAGKLRSRLLELATRRRD